MALYICYKIWKGFGTKYAICWAVISLSIISWWAFIPRIFEINTPPALTVIGYMYLPFTGYSFIFLLAAELIEFVLWRLRKYKFNDKRKLLFVFTLVVVLLCYGYFEAKNIRTREVILLSEKLPNDTDTIKIVQISDLHIGKTFDDSLLNKAMEITNAASPDLIVLTGDIIDRDMRRDEYYRKALGSLKAPLGKFFITGNHEHYAGFAQATAFMAIAGYTVLRSDWHDLGPIVIAGVDDPGRGVVAKDADGFLSSLPAYLRNKFILFLKHQPHVHEGTVGLFDLQLSGHTHGGQIWPLGYLMSYLHGVKQGLSSYAGSSLYVSNGTGYWGPPVRISAPPEVTVINVVRRQS